MKSVVEPRFRKRLGGSSHILGLYHLTALWLSLLAALAVRTDAGAQELQLIAPSGYVPNIPLLIRVEALRPDGSYDRSLWDAEAQLTVDDPDVALSTNRVWLRNGLGSAMVTFTGGTNFNLVAALETMAASRPLTNLSDAPVQQVAGPLAGTTTVWSGVVQMTGDVTVPAGHTLILEAGTWVLIDGVSSGTSANDLIIQGTLETRGTTDAPVTLTCTQPDRRWGQIRHENAAPSTYRHTTISFAGRAPGEGHTGTGPAIRANNTTLTFDRCNLTDHADASGAPGKVMAAYDSDLVFDGCLLTRSRMGPEISGTAILFTNSYVLDMRGPDDADGIYLHSQSSGQRADLIDSVFAGGDDDAIDTYGATVNVEGCILRDWSNPAEDAKAISVFHGDTHVRWTLVAYCYAGVSAKSSGPLSLVTLDHCTIAGQAIGLSAAYKSNATNGNIQFLVTNSIIRSADAVYSDFGPDKFQIGYCNLSEDWPGAGNFNRDPAWVAEGLDYRLRPVSPCIDAGDPAAPVDPDGTRTDLGAFLLGQTGLSVARDGVVINEIMYHPASEDVLEEYLELHNRGTNAVDLSGWRLSAGVQFQFPSNLVIQPLGYLVVAADLATFTGKYPGVSNVVGNWEGILSNQGEDIDLDDATGQRVDRVTYAEEGDWAARVRGPLDRNHRGWLWQTPHDGLGRSLELRNPYLSNNYGHNWAPSRVPEGTPGAVNSASAGNVEPLVLDPAHFPVIPRAGEPVAITARVLDERVTGTALSLHYRISAAEAVPFEVLPMRDDGLQEDGAPGDGIYGVLLAGQTNHSVVEFYFEAQDAEGQRRFWPSPARQTDGRFAQTANLLYQVDDSTYTGAQPLYRLIMTEGERYELVEVIHRRSPDAASNAQMNATFISQDGSGAVCRYLVGVRNRGHGTRGARPNNFRVNFRSDDQWKDVVALNINAQYTHAQHFGAVLALRSGLAGAEARPVQLRVNNANLGNNGPQTYGGVYVANEVLNSDFANHRFPFDSAGNVYRAMRDIAPSDFAYRGEDPDDYRNTWFKETNVSEDDWSDLIGMLRIVGAEDEWTVQNVQEVIDLDQWMLYLAVMALFNNRETSPNTGHNDDYFMYAGAVDRRFRLMYFDLDTILGQGNSVGATDSTLLGAAAMPAFERLLEHPEFEAVYYRTLERLIDTSVSAAVFNALIQQTLGDYVPAQTIDTMISWMNARRDYVRSQIYARFPQGVPPVPRPLTAVLSNLPRSPTPLAHAEIWVSGSGVTRYRYRLDGGAFGPDAAASTPILLSNLTAGDHRLEVIAGDDQERWQSESAPTVLSWVVNLSWPAVRLNEILARNDTAVNHHGTFPDLIELYNEASTAVNLAGMHLTDNPNRPTKYTFPTGTTLEAGQYLVLVANDPDGTPGLHLGFALSEDGEGVHLFDTTANGNRLLDAVVFGRQAPNLSIGRFSSGDWVLTQPSFGSANVVQATADNAGLVLNEWLALGRALFADDFLELYNPSDLPAALGGLYLSDNLTSAPQRHRLPPLSFLSPRGYLAFRADGNVDQGANHVGFRLASEQGELALFNPDLELIDAIIYGPQQPDVSQGRSPDGAIDLAFFRQPTPGAPNLFQPSNVTTEHVNLVAATNVWRYNQTEDLTTLDWTNPTFDDRAWPEGPALLYFEDDPLDWPKNTELELGRMTYYFRTHFAFGLPTNGLTASLSAVLDDGAVFYLNGEFLLAVGMPEDEPIDYSTRASRSVGNATTPDGPFAIPVDRLQPGDNVLAVEVHQSSSTSSDIVFGLTLDTVRFVTNSLLFPVTLNEVLARNRAIPNPDGSVTDWIELYNTATTNVDLADLSLSDELDRPRKWVFPVGSVISAGDHWRIRCDPDTPAAPDNTGFGLETTGDGIHLFDRPANNSRLLDSIVFGFQAADLSLGRIPDGYGSWGLTLPTPASANLPASLAEPDALRINEWLANAPQDDDWFEVFNPTGQPVPLGGLCLTDDLLDRDKSPIPPLSFIGAGADAYRKFVADDNPGQGPDHVRFNLDAGGESIGLFTADGRRLDSVSFGPQPANVSQGRFPDGAAAVVAFPTTPTPGESNYLPLTNVVINELLSHTDPPLEDALELLNPGSDAVELGGWYLSNSAEDFRKFRIPDGARLEPQAYQVFYEYQFGDPEQPAPFAFNSAHGDAVYLSAADPSGTLTGYRAQLEFGAAANGISFGRHETSIGADFVPLSRPTFDVAQPQTLEQFRTGTGAANAYPLVGPAVITELMFCPPPFNGTNDNIRDEYVEIQNLTAAPLPLFDPAAPTNTWHLRGGVDFDFPTNLTLPAGGVLLVVNFDPTINPDSLQGFQATYPTTTNALILGPCTGQLSNQGEAIRLLKPDPPQQAPQPDAGFVPYVLVEQIEYAAAAPWPTNAVATGFSLQRLNAHAYGNEPLNWKIDDPTPGRTSTELPPDSDGDGLPDGWELEFFQTLDRDGTGDFDLDGLSDLEEYRLGTDPTLFGSALRLSASPIPGSQVRFSFTAVLGHTYTVQVRDSLVGGDWQPFLEVGPGVEGVVFWDVDQSPDSARFFQVLSPALP